VVVMVVAAAATSATARCCDQKQQETQRVLTQVYVHTYTEPYLVIIRAELRCACCECTHRNGVSIWLSQHFILGETHQASLAHPLLWTDGQAEKEEMTQSGSHMFIWLHVQAI
jgi:hypothetical protein